MEDFSIDSTSFDYIRFDSGAFVTIYIMIEKLRLCFSGTEKQVVAYDYAERLANGIMEGQVWCLCCLFLHKSIQLQPAEDSVTVRG